MAELQQWAEVGRELTSLLRLRTFPLAIKLVKSTDEFPEKTRFPSKQLGQKALVCQSISMARIYGWTVGLTPQDCVICPGPLIFGWMEIDESGDLASFWVKDLPLFQNEAAAAKFLSSVPRLKKGEYKGMVISPLEWTRVVPDVVMMHCNPAQAMRLVHGSIYHDGEPLTSTYGAILGTCRAIVDPVLTGQPRATVPGIGDRVAGGLQDDEMIFSAPAAKMERIMEGVRVHLGTLGGIRYPVPVSWLRVPGIVPYANIEDKFRLVEC